MIAAPNLPFISPAGNEAILAANLERLADDAALREEIGSANRKRAEAEYDEDKMVAAYRAVYSRALGRPDFP